MTKNAQEGEDGKHSKNRPRGVLRVPEVLVACASRPEGGSLATLGKELKFPKTSLHRLLRTLEYGGYLENRSGYYVMGPQSFHMARLIAQLQPRTTFPMSAMPTLEWLAKETSESAMLGIISEERTDIVYISAIDSTEQLRYTLPIGVRRPLFSGASGKVVLAFFTPEERTNYLAHMAFFQMTTSGTTREELPALLEQLRQDAVIYDRNGSFEGASAISAPIFDRNGAVFAAISLAGPTERMDANRDRFCALGKSAAERISRGLGYVGVYPPR